MVKRLIPIMTMAFMLTGCTSTALNRQSLDQVNAAIESANGFKLRADAGEPVDPTLVDIHLGNLNGLKQNLERSIHGE